MQTPKDLFLNVDGYKIRYWKCGNGKSTILLLHGFALSCEVWKKNIEHLSKEYTVVALDILGFGQSDIPSRQQSYLEFIPEFIHSFMKAAGIEKACVIGHSIGGLFSMVLTAKHPQCVEKLILVGSAGFKRNIPFHLRIFSLPFLGEFITKPNRTGFKHALKHNAYSKESIQDDFIDALYEYAKQPGRRIFFLNAARHAISFFGFRTSALNLAKKSLNSIQIPTLLVWGRNDPIIRLQHGLKARKILKNSKLVVFDKCGHLPQLEMPEAFNREVLNFLTHT